MDHKPKHSGFPQRGPVDGSGREVLLSLRNVDVNFGKGEKLVRAAKDVAFDVYKGETFSIVGESGSGKTTVARAIVRANACARGEIRYKGVRISGKIPRSLDREVIRNIQMVFQDPATSLNERATIDHIVSEGLVNFRLYKNEADRRMKVDRIIRDVGLLSEHLTRYPHELSGGQRQRVGLARAMVMEPELVVADEPISALDVSIRATILNLINKFKRDRDTTCIFIAHDLSVVRYISDRIAVIYKGNIVEVAPAEELYDFPMHPYTRSLISAIPIPDPRLERAKLLYSYDASEHSYGKGGAVGSDAGAASAAGAAAAPKLTLIGHGHYIYGDGSEIEKYKAIRERNVPLQSLSVVGVNAEAPAESVGSASNAALEEILERPVHDTGRALYGVLAFMLPFVGLPAAYLFKRRNYIRNFKVCRKGAVASLALLGAMLLFLGVLIIAAIA